MSAKHFIFCLLFESNIPFGSFLSLSLSFISRYFSTRVRQENRMSKRTASKKSRQPHPKSKKSDGVGKQAKSTGPKKLSGYLVFCAEQRTRRKSELEQMPPKEIMKHLGAEWRKLSPQQQQAYKSKAPAHGQHHASDKAESASSKSHSHKGGADHHSKTKSSSSAHGASGKRADHSKESSGSHKAAHQDHAAEHDHE